MLRSPRHILENRLEVLHHEQCHLASQIASTEARLLEARQLYDSLASHWQSIGPAAVLNDADRRLARQAQIRAFWRGVVLGAAVPMSVGVGLLMLYRF
jgi:hypothetical protein